MVDRISTAQRSENMRRIKGTDTIPEMVVRRLVHSMGHRYRLHRKDLPGNPDLVFGTRRKIVFVHGCFWHQHPACGAGRLPASNSSYWHPKLQRNVKRDAEVRSALERGGWTVLVIWDCETKDVAALRERLFAFLSGPGEG